MPHGASSEALAVPVFSNCTWQSTACPMLAALDGPLDTVPPSLRATFWYFLPALSPVLTSWGTVSPRVPHIRVSPRSPCPRFLGTGACMSTGMDALRFSFADCVSEVAVRANDVEMATSALDRLGAWLPASGYPRNPWDTGNVKAPWRVPNVFASVSDKDVCRELARSVQDHDPSLGQLRVVLLGPSGCGKTFVIRSLPGLLDGCVVDPGFRARCVVVSMDFSGSKLDEANALGDGLTLAFMEAVDSLALPSPRGPGGVFDPAVNVRNYNAVRPLVHRFLLVRLYLVAVIESLGFIPCTADDYFLTQLTSWAGKRSAAAFRAVARFPDSEVVAALDVLGRLVKRVVLAVDEAGVAAKLYEHTFCSFSEESAGAPRGLLGAVLRCASSVAAVVLAGTTLRLHHCEVLGSGLGKDLPLVVLTQFPTMTGEQSCSLLSSLLRVPSGDVAATTVKLLAGKGRYMQVLWEKFKVAEHGTPASFLELVHTVRDKLVADTKCRALAAIETGAWKWCVC